MDITKTKKVKLHDMTDNGMPKHTKIGYDCQHSKVGGLSDMTNGIVEHGKGKK